MFYIFFWVHLLEFLWVCFHDRHLEGILYLWVVDLIGMNFYLGFFLDHLSDFLGIPPWLAPSEVLLGRLLFKVYPLGISILPCVHLLVQILGLHVLDYVVHELSTARHELLHLWSKYLACWILWGEFLLCLIFFRSWFGDVCLMISIVFHEWSYIPYIRIIHVAPIMICNLSYCELPFFYLVGLTVCGCNWIIQICACRLIGGDEFLIVWAYLDLFLPAVVICPITGVGSIYLHCIVPPQSGFWRSEGISMYFLPYDYFGKPTVTSCIWLSLPVLKMLILHCPRSGIMGWFHSFLSFRLTVWKPVSFTCHFCY